MTANNVKLERLSRPPKERPVSAPVTKHEEITAYRSAGETDNYVYRQNDKNRPRSCKPKILYSIEKEIKEGTLIDPNARSREETEKLIDQLRGDILDSNMG